MKKDDFNGCPNKNKGVQQDHPAKFRIGNFRTTISDDLLLVTFGNLQLDDAQRSDGEQQREKCDDA